MINYTPTTEEVRAEALSDSPSSLRPAEFDRWLAEVKAEAWAEGAVAVHMYFDYKPNSKIPRNPYAVKKEEQ